jgi:hypothetical protein
MLHQWLVAEEKSLPRDRIAMWSVAELPGAATTSSLVPALADHLIGNEYLAKAAAQLPPSKLRSLVASRLPATLPLKHGFYGEVLTAVLLEEFHGHKVPVKKLRLRTSKFNSPTATDVLAIGLSSEGVITDVVYVETKVRTTRNGLSALAESAHRQLKADCAEESPAIIGFVAQVLLERNDPLFEAVMAYLRDREVLDLDRHHVFLILEEGMWRESDIDSLMALDDLLEPLEIHVVSLRNLARRVAEEYNMVGCEAIGDDE